ncbi:hypothetical protein KKHLCK_09190 [Candidatus Electrothrix laxa]
MKMLTNQKHQNCKERRKYYLAILLLVLIAFSSQYLFELFLNFIESDNYVSIRDKANKSENVQFFSSFCTIFGASVISLTGYFQKRFLKKEKEFDDTIRLIHTKKLIDKTKLNQGKEEYANQEKNLHRKINEKRQELSQKIFLKEDHSFLLDEIKNIEKEIKEVQDKLFFLGKL